MRHIEIESKEWVVFNAGKPVKNQITSIGCGGVFHSNPYLNFLHTLRKKQKLQSPNYMLKNLVSSNLKTEYERTK